MLFYNSAGCISLINTSPPANFDHRTGNTAHRATPDREKNSRCSSRLQSWPDSAAALSCGKKQASEKLIMLGGGSLQLIAVIALGARAGDGRDPILHCGQVRVR